MHQLFKTGSWAVVVASLVAALWGCGGGTDAGGGPALGDPAFVQGSYSRNNSMAEDLLDHWDEPGLLRETLELSAIRASAATGRAEVLANLLETAEGDRATGTLLRNVRPEDVEIIGERAGITYGRWQGGPAGALNIEFDWRFAPNVSAATRARMERAGKSWSWRILDDFGAHTVTRGTEIVHGPDITDGSPVTGVLDEDIVTDGVLIFLFSERSSSFSSGGPQLLDVTSDDVEPWLGAILLSSQSLESTFVMAHEIGHVLGIGSVGGAPSIERYTNYVDHVFVGPEATRANGGEPVPFQWWNDQYEPVPPHTPGAEVDYGHLGVCTSLMAYCSDPTVTYRPSELDFAYLDDIGYEILDAGTAAEPELYGYGAWGRYSAWGVGVERTIRYQGGNVVAARDSLRVGADAFGISPGTGLGELRAPSGVVTWSGSLIGVDLGRTMLPPVLGDAELRVELSSLKGAASFDGLTVLVDGVSTGFRAPRLEYAISVSENSFTDGNGRVRGGFFGPSHDEMAGVLDDRAPDVNLLAGFGGKR